MPYMEADCAKCLNRKLNLKVFEQLEFTKILLEQLFHSRFLNMSCFIASSYPTRARGIIILKNCRIESMTMEKKYFSSRKIYFVLAC